MESLGIRENRLIGRVSFLVLDKFRGSNRAIPFEYDFTSFLDRFHERDRSYPSAVMWRWEGGYVKLIYFIS